MNQDDPKRTDKTDEDLEAEIREGRKFTLEEAIGRMAGKDLMKGASPVTRKRRAELRIEGYLETHFIDSEGALETVLLRRISNSRLLLDSGYDEPLKALADFIEHLLGSESRLEDFVREVDAQWGRIYMERPYFQKKGQPPREGDPYTFASVRQKLTKLLEQLRHP